MKNSKNKLLGILGISACALCCTLPIVGALFGFTALVSMGVWLEKVAMLFLGLGAAAFIIPYVIKRGRSRNTSSSCATTGKATCTTDCSCNPVSSAKETIH